MDQTSLDNYTESEIQKLQRVENSVYRQILGAPRYAQTAALRGEIGSSSMASRIIGNQIQYVQYIETNKGERNELLKRILQERKEFKNDYWITSLKDNVGHVVEDYKLLKTLSRDQLKKKIQDWDTRMWQEELCQKSSLKIYRSWKKNIKGEEKLYDNRPASVILFKGRTNNLQLNDRKRHSG